VADPIQVLLIDDEPIVCERLGEFLRTKGVEVEAFTDSGEAVSRLGERVFDVVITDLKMAGPTGLDILRLIRDAQPPTPGILITAYSVLDALREAEVLNAFDVITKPFQLSDMYKLVQKAARRARKQRA
jgi:DNA-binding NtrC family response regulator